MSDSNLIKNITFSEPHVLVDLVDYKQGQVISQTFAQNENISLTLFAFDIGEGLSTHAAPGDAMVQVIDGEVKLTIGGEEILAKAGEIVVMPANVPHSVKAERRFKMLLIVVKK